MSEKGNLIRDDLTDFLEKLEERIEKLEHDLENVLEQEEHIQTLEGYVSDCQDDIASLKEKLSSIPLANDVKLALKENITLAIELIEKNRDIIRDHYNQEIEWGELYSNAKTITNPAERMEFYREQLKKRDSNDHEKDYPYDLGMIFSNEDGELEEYIPSQFVKDFAKNCRAINIFGFMIEEPIDSDVIENLKKARKKIENTTLHGIPLELNDGETEEEVSNRLSSTNVLDGSAPSTSTPSKGLLPEPVGYPIPHEPTDEFICLRCGIFPAVALCERCYAEVYNEPLIEDDGEKVVLKDGKIIDFEKLTEQEKTLVKMREMYDIIEEKLNDGETEEEVSNRLSSTNVLDGSAPSTSTPSVIPIKIAKKIAEEHINQLHEPTDEPSEFGCKPGEKWITIHKNEVVVKREDLKRWKQMGEEDLGYDIAEEIEKYLEEELKKE